MGHTSDDASLASFLFFDPVTRVGKVFVTNIELLPGPRSLGQFKIIWKYLDQVR